ncbi:MAG: hypothetical protein EBX37_08365 [Alphaproteobacteria bacterium]|nr:hypothetical protein [Alphaproteobacteria bacterium]
MATQGTHGMGREGFLMTKAARMLARYGGRVPLPFSHSRSIISFSFDDFPLSAFTHAVPLMQQQDIRATFYTCLGVLGTDSDVGKLAGASHVRECAMLGHEIGCHTFAHEDSSAMTVSWLRSSLHANQGAAAALMLPALRSFAYPFGRYSLRAKRIAMHSYDCARTTEWGINRGVMDLGLLKAVPIYSRLGAAPVQGFLDALKAKPGWLILYTHDVDDTPSPYGCTREELAHIISQCRAQDCDIMPVGQALQVLRG